jgi:heavy metal translocating P-type ATPase
VSHACAHCGLPAAGQDAYCCYGCEIAAELAADAADDHARVHASLAAGMVLSMIVMMFSLFLYAEDIYEAGEDAGLGWMRVFYRWASAALALPVMILCGGPLVKSALRRAREGKLSMPAMIAAGAFAAYGLSLGSLFNGGTKIYFDSATAALVLATFGRWLEATARTKASGIAGRGLDGALERVEAFDGDRPLGALAPAELRPGMRLSIPPERVVPVDVVAERAAEIDRAVLTGESSPVAIAPGDVVPAGAVPLHAALVGRAITDAKSSALAQLALLARGLRERPSRLLEIADRFARVLTPFVAALALGTLVYWGRRQGLEAGVVNALSVVLVACPCSYAIAAPLVHWLAMRRALREGVLIRSAEALEDLAQVEVVAFDKTGTITSSALRAAPLRLEDEREVRALVSALEADTRHPVGRALHAWAGDAAPARLNERRFVPGRGVEAEDERGRALFLGSGHAGELVLLRDGAELARFELEESIRPEASSAIDQLTGAGIRSVILTGDRSARAEKVAVELGIEARSGLSPEEKVDRILGAGGRAAMVGDGMNDAPALAGAVGIAMCGGSGLSRGVARINLLADDLLLVPRAISIARRARRWVLRLLIGSTVYNTVFLALAVTGMLRPVWAGVSMLVSSLLAIAVAAAGMEA